MTQPRFVCLASVLLVAIPAWSCDARSDAASYGGDDFGGDPLGGGDTGSAGGDEGAAGGNEGEGPPPEVEMPGDFRVPKPSGRFVYSASEDTHAVAVIDSNNLDIHVVGVGRNPSVVTSIARQSNDAGAVAVLDEGSQDVAVLRTTAAGVTAVNIVDVTPGANNLVASSDGVFVIAFADVDAPASGQPGSDQEATIIDTQALVATRITVGSHPRDIVFATDMPFAYVVTADGVNVLDLSALADLDKPDIVPVYSDLGVYPDELEVYVAPDAGLAITRRDNEASFVVTDLGTGAQETFALPGIPTDLDIASNDAYALFVMPSTNGSQLAELPLPLGSGELRIHSVPGEYVGLAALSPAGDVALLFTSQDPFTGGTDNNAQATDSGDSSSGTGAAVDTSVPSDRDPRQRLTIARRDGDTFDTSLALFVDRPIRSVGIAPDGETAVLVHEPIEDAPAWSYTLVDLTKDVPVKKLQSVLAEPTPLLFTPDGARAIVLQRDDTSNIRGVDRINLRTFIVESLTLGSSPEGAGYIDATQKLFVSQDHPSGRITLLGPTGSVETVTGYTLGERIKD